MAHNLIVDEEYIRNETARIGNALISLDSAIETYQEILNTTIVSGIKDGATSETLKAFLETVRQLKGVMKTAGENLRSFANDYLHEIDDADQFLF